MNTMRKKWDQNKIACMLKLNALHFLVDIQLYQYE